MIKSFRLVALMLATLLTATACQLVGLWETNSTPTVAMPAISPASGQQGWENFTVTISCDTSGGIIHYTTDGTKPTSGSPIYAEPFQIQAPAQVMAYATRDGYNDSAVAFADWEKQKILINEVQYDDYVSGESSSNPKDNQEFVELYNAGIGPVDITGYTLKARSWDPTSSSWLEFNSFTIPGSPDTPTLLESKGYYVLGANNPALPHDATFSDAIPCNWLPDGTSSLELADSAGTLVDSVGWELWRYPAATPLAKGGVFGNFQSWMGTSLSRVYDGYDSGDAGRDFVVRTATPGTANSTGVGSVWNGPNVDSASVDAELSGWHAAFVMPHVVDPVSADAWNPSAIQASPQGGKAMVAWDNTGGGNSDGLDLAFGPTASFDIWIYIDPTPLSSSGYEEWDIGIGGDEDALGNSTQGGSYGGTGPAWTFRRTSASASLILYDRGGGGSPDSWKTVGTVASTDLTAGWHRLGISIDGTAISGRFDSQSFDNAKDPAAAPMQGNFHIGYHDGTSSADHAIRRPPTLDLWQAN